MKTSRKTSFRPAVEALEDRRLMSVYYIGVAREMFFHAPLEITSSSSQPDHIVLRSTPNGNLQILGSVDGKDGVQPLKRWGPPDGLTSDMLKDIPEIDIDCSGSTAAGHWVDLSGIDPKVAAGMKFKIIGCQGNDRLTGAPAGQNEIYGGGGDDIITGGAASTDLLVAGTAPGTAYANNIGNATIRAGDGNDTLIGGAGYVELWAGKGNDLLVSHSTTERRATLHGGSGNDTLIASDAGDRLYGGTGNDSLVGGKGNDLIVAGTGNDTLIGNGGDDTLQGGPGNDKLYAGIGHSTLVAGTGTTFLSGNPATDLIKAHQGGIAYRADEPALLHPGDKGLAVDGDIHQAATADTCWILAAVGAATKVRDLAAGISYEGNSIFDVTLYRNGQPVVQKVFFDGTLTRTDPTPAQDGEFWVVLYQRALLQELKPGLSWHDDAAVAAAKGNTADALTALTGQKCGMFTLDRSDALTALQQALSLGRPVVANTTTDPNSLSPYLVGGHSYEVLAAKMVNGQMYVQLRNPWGVDGAKAFGNPNDGIVIVSWNAFVQSMDAFVVNSNLFAPKDPTPAPAVAAHQVTDQLFVTGVQLRKALPAARLA